MKWLTTLLEDSQVTDVCINATAGVFVDRGNGMEPWPMAGTPEAPVLHAWAIDVLAQSGRGWDARFPFADATLNGCHRIHVVFPPIAPQGILISIRKHSSAQTHQDVWKKNIHYDSLKNIVLSNETLLLSGATGSGKTTLLMSLLADIPHSQRIIALEDTAELAVPHPHFVSLLSRQANADGHGAVPLHELLRQCLRMRPDRIILGECRGKEMLDLLQLLNTGHRGAAATLHADSARDALKRIELLCLLSAGSNLSVRVIRELISQGVQWVAQVGRTPQGDRKIEELIKIEGLEGDTLLVRPMLKQNPPWSHPSVVPPPEPSRYWGSAT